MWRAREAFIESILREHFERAFLQRSSCGEHGKRLESILDCEQIIGVQSGFIGSAIVIWQSRERRKREYRRAIPSESGSRSTPSR
jgi:hypothetical protein